MAFNFICSGCRLSLLRQFTAVSEIANHHIRRSARSSAFQTRRNGLFSTSSRPASTSDQFAEGEEDALSSHTSTKENAHAEQTPLPWYLQKQSAPQPTDSAHPLAERQRIPELPVDPPPILQPMLEHISVELGLDDLLLLDLRKLDPPPALGANLLMIIGTARSEKHLHVSADRHCRWLRSTYKLKPYADGLLGRNEIKLRMRRKVRRSRLYKSVGAEEADRADENIRTGWVCVNVGKVEAAEGAAPALEQPEGFVGFGQLSNETAIVVQMFTEEKRSEVDLEGLWQGVMSRANRKAQSDTSALNAMELEGRPTHDQSQDSEDPMVYPPPRSEQPAQHSIHGWSGWNGQQVRTYHTSRVLHDMRISGLPLTISKHNNWIRQGGLSYEGPRFSYSTAPEPHSEPSHTVHSSSNMQIQLRQLHELDRETALRILGTGSNDQSSTAFLTSFYNNVPLDSNCNHWESVIDLHRIAIELGHPGYRTSDLHALLINMQVAGAELLEDLLLSVLKSTLVPVKRLVAAGRHVRQTEVATSIEILDMMHELGYEPITTETILALHDAVVPVDAAALAEEAKASAVAQQDQLQYFMDLFGIDFRHDGPYLQLLRKCAALQHWKGFWGVWKSMAQRMYARSADLYAFFFSTMAKTRHQARCVLALRLCVPEMELEIPRVPLQGEVAAAVMECLLVAEPQLNGAYPNERQPAGEWVKLWKKCQEGLTATRMA